MPDLFVTLLSWLAWPAGFLVLRLVLIYRRALSHRWKGYA